MSEQFDGATSRLVALVVDVPAARFEDTVAFWAAALSATPDPVPGMPGGDATYVHLRQATAVTDVLVQRLDAGDRPGFHLDLAVADRQAAVRAAQGLGGTVVAEEDRWTVLADPAGLPLCVGFPDPEPAQVAPRRGDRGYLDVVFLDVPAPRVTAEVAFWSTLLGARPVPPSASDPAYHALAGVRALGDVPVSVEVQAVATDADRDGPARAPRVHVDLAVDDVPGEVARLEAAGAARVATIEDWVTLVDPAGAMFCVVPTPSTS